MRSWSLASVVLAFGLALVSGCGSKKDTEGGGGGDPSGGGGGVGGGGGGGSSFKPVGSWETHEKLLFSAADAAAKLVPKSFHVSPDGKRLAYAVKEGDKFAWIVDGKKGPLLGEVAGQSFTFSGDSRRFVYVGRPTDYIGPDSSRVAVFVDNTPVGDASVGGNYFSDSVWTNHDGTEYALNTKSSAAVGSEFHLGRNDKELRFGRGSPSPIVQPGKRLAWTSGFYSDGSVVVNGEKVVIPGATPLQHGTHGFCFSANGESYAFLATQDNQQFLVFNGKPQKRFTAVGKVRWNTFDTPIPLIVLSADGNHYLHLAGDGTQPLMIHDGTRHELPGEPAYSQPFVLSPDGKRWACYVWTTAPSGGHSLCTVILDGKKGKDYVSIGESAKPVGVFSPDNKHFAHAAVVKVKEKERDARGKEREFEKEYAVMVRDGVEQTRFAWVSPVPVFSPDGKYLAYTAAATKDGKRFMTVDGTKLTTEYDAYHDKVPASFSPDSGHLAFVARRAGNWHVVLDGQERTGYDAIGPDGTRIGFTPEGTYTYLANRGGAYYWVEERRK